jgi:electron transfer flavoprotein alpha subunit
MADNRDVFILLDSVDSFAELCTCALGITVNTKGAVKGIVCRPFVEAEDLAATGMDALFILKDTQEEALFEDFVPTIAELLVKERPCCLLIGDSQRGRLIAARLAAILGASLVARARSLFFDGVRLAADYLDHNALVLCTVSCETDIMIVTIEAGVFEPHPQTTSVRPEEVEVTFIEPKRRMRLVRKNRRRKSFRSLSSANIVIGIGYALKRKEDLAIFQELADALSAPVGCTRKVSENLLSWPMDRHIGLSGALIHPDIYLAFGISGMVQHTAGIVGAKTIIAMNKDRGAPLFSHADYWIQGDLYELVPKLTAEIIRRKGRANPEACFNERGQDV